jgi:hypothetical protein
MPVANTQHEIITRRQPLLPFPAQELSAPLTDASTELRTQIPGHWQGTDPHAPPTRSGQRLINHARAYLSIHRHRGVSLCSINDGEQEHKRGYKTPRGNHQHKFLAPSMDHSKTTPTSKAVRQPTASPSGDPSYVENRDEKTGAGTGAYGVCGNQEQPAKRAPKKHGEKSAKNPV